MKWTNRRYVLSAPPPSKQPSAIVEAISTLGGVVLLLTWLTIRVAVIATVTVWLLRLFGVL